LPQAAGRNNYGLALSSRFELSEDEATFFDRHRTYDRCYTRTYLVHWLVTCLHGNQPDERDALIRAYAEGEQPTAIPPCSRGRPYPARAADLDDGQLLPRASADQQGDPYPQEKIRCANVMPSPPGS
jgi:hypothetical protein